MCVCVCIICIYYQLRHIDLIKTNKDKIIEWDGVGQTAAPPSPINRKKEGKKKKHTCVPVMFKFEIRGRRHKNSKMRQCLRTLKYVLGYEILICRDYRLIYKFLFILIIN